MPMQEADAVRLVRVETAFEAHLKHCDERADRTATDISSMRDNLHSMRNQMQSGTQRIHERIEAGNAQMAELHGDMKTMKETVAGVRDAAKAGANAAVSSVKIWLYVQSFGVLGFIIVAAIALAELRKGP